MLQLSTNQIKFAQEFAAVVKRNSEIQSADIQESAEYWKEYREMVRTMDLSWMTPESRLICAVDIWCTLNFEMPEYSEPVVKERKYTYRNPGWTIGDVVNRDEIYSKFSRQQ